MLATKQRGTSETIKNHMIPFINIDVWNELGHIPYFEGVLLMTTY